MEISIKIPEISLRTMFLKNKNEIFPYLIGFPGIYRIENISN